MHHRSRFHSKTFIALCVLQFLYCPSHGRRRNNSKGNVKFITSTRHLHLSVGNDPSTSMIISFTSAPVVENGGKNKKKREFWDGAVLVGKDPLKLNRLVLEHEPPLRYNASLPSKKMKKMKGIDVNHLPYSSDFLHHVKVDGLEPDTKYYYKCANIVFEDDDDEDDYGEEEETDQERQRLRHLHVNRDLRKKGIDLHLPAPNVPEINTFRTAPIVGSGYESTKLAIIGDVALLPHSVDTISHLNDERHDISAVLLVGDIAYANCDHSLWDAWFDMMDDFAIFREKPLQVAAGNHEVERDSITEQVFVSYEHRFRMPRIRPAVMGKFSEHEITPAKIPYPLQYDFGNSYYSFGYGPSWNIVLNSYASFEPNSAQYRWLISELEKLDRSITPWVTATIHCPIYNTFVYHKQDPQAAKAREHLEPIFIKYHVNFVLSGHLHAYMRTKNVENKVPTPDGPIHFILGNGGRNVNSPYRNEVPEPWLDVRDHSTYGYGTFMFFNKTHCRYEWIQTGVAKPGDAKLQHAPIFEPVRGLKDDDVFENQYFIKNPHLL